MFSESNQSSKAGNLKGRAIGYGVIEYIFTPDLNRLNEK